MATSRTKAVTPSKPDPFKAAGDLSTESLTDLCKGLPEPQRAKVAKVVAKSRARADGPEMGLNKLARTYAMQMEALKRYRTGGQQKMTVEHVTVNAGGQAIVGAVTRAAE